MGIACTRFSWRGVGRRNKHILLLSFRGFNQIFLCKKGACAFQTIWILSSSLLVRRSDICNIVGFLSLSFKLLVDLQVTNIYHIYFFAACCLWKLEQPAPVACTFFQHYILAILEISSSSIISMNSGIAFKTTLKAFSGSVF